MMIEKTVKKLDLKRDSSIKEDLAYWLSRTPQERIGAIEFLRGQYHGSSARLQRNFAKLWSLTRTQLQMIGWNSQAGSIIELYINNQNSEWTEKIFISPGFVERFLVRITPRADHIGKILDAMKEATSEMLIQPKVATHRIKRTPGFIDVVDIETSLFEVLGKSADAESMEKTLWECVGSIIRKIK